MRHAITVVVLLLGVLAALYGGLMLWGGSMASSGDQRTMSRGAIVCAIGLLAIVACGVMLAQ